MNDLITPERALNSILDATSILEHQTIGLEQAMGSYLAKSIDAPIDHPIFDQSAVDGYAFCYSEWKGDSPLRVADMVRAGDAGERLLGAGECCRIFTGAPLPAGADTVVMQEHTVREGEFIRVQDAGLKQGGNVRWAGEQLRKGDTALQKGTVIGAAAVGFLASLGIRQVEVHRKPIVHIIVTGDEFASNEEEFRRGKIYESNGKMLVSALGQLGVEARFTTCEDSLAALTEMVALQSQNCDVLILTGGVSVGDYDFSRGALEGNGFQVVFHQVAQKPGKPLLFCRRGSLAAFGLPGNPRAVLMCFYLYVLPYLNAIQGAAQLGLPEIQLPLQHDFKRKADGKTHFVTGSLSGSGVSLLDGQASHMLQSFAAAGVIVELPSEIRDFPAGMLLKCRLI